MPRASNRLRWNCSRTNINICPRIKARNFYRSIRAAYLMTACQSLAEKSHLMDISLVHAGCSAQHHAMGHFYSQELSTSHGVFQGWIGPTYEALGITQVWCRYITRTSTEGMYTILQWQQQHQDIHNRESKAIYCDGGFHQQNEYKEDAVCEYSYQLSLAVVASLVVPTRLGSSCCEDSRFMSSLFMTLINWSLEYGMALVRLVWRLAEGNQTRG